MKIIQISNKITTSHLKRSALPFYLVHHSKKKGVPDYLSSHREPKHYLLSLLLELGSIRRGRASTAHKSRKSTTEAERPTSLEPSLRSLYAQESYLGFLLFHPSLHSRQYGVFPAIILLTFIKVGDSSQANFHIAKKHFQKMDKNGE